MHKHRHLVATAFALAAACLASAAAHASVVSFTGGFTSFRGPVATGPGDYAAVIHTEINGVTVYADQPFPGAQFGFDNYGLGLKNTFSLLDGGGNPIPSVTFNRIFYSAPNPNIVSFTPSGPLEVGVGSTFSIGTFSLTNGAWFGNSPGDNLYPDTDFGFSVTTHSSDPLLDGFTFAGVLSFVVTAGYGPTFTIEQDADFFYFVDKPELGTMRVYEAVDPEGNPLPLGNTGTIDLQVRIGSLIPVGLVNATGAAFVGSPVSTVPEPGMVGLWLAGLAAVGFSARRRLVVHGAGWQAGGVRA